MARFKPKDYRPIPTRYQVTGDIKAGKALIGLGKRQLSILENQMELGNLNQGIRTIRLADGSIITAVKSFGVTQVFIETPQPGGAPQEEGQFCFCCRCIAMGTVMGLFDKQHHNYNDPKILFDVEVCQGDHYLVFEGCKPTDFAEYPAMEDGATPEEAQVLVFYASGGARCNDSCLHSDICIDNVSCSAVVPQNYTPGLDPPIFILMPIKVGFVPKWITT